jgi:Bifunctional DNA primase/polymerase, N-terminal
MTTYQDAHPIYRRWGWPSLIPLRPGTKLPPPEGFTGWDGIDPSYADSLDWDENPRYRGTCQAALRLPSTVVGIDVDAYDGRTGSGTIAEASRRWEPLPDGPWSSARDDGASGIRLFRVPDGTVLVANLAFHGLKLGHVEVVQRHHRYVVVWPSIHPKTRTRYTWRNTAGPDVLPAVTDLPELPASWLEGLAGHGRSGDRARPEQVEQFFSALPTGSACTTVTSALRAAESSLRTPVVCRHDDTRDAVLRLLRLGEQGHPGTTRALTALKARFTNVVTADGSRTPASAVAEFERMVDGDNGIGLLLATPTDSARRGCRCMSAQEPPTRAALLGILRKVIRATDDERPALTAWATRKLRGYAAAGQLDQVYVANVIDQLQQVGGGGR